MPKRGGKRKKVPESDDDKEARRLRMHSIAGVKIPKTKKERRALERLIKRNCGS
jgi:hypothetical protein